MTDASKPWLTVEGLTLVTSFNRVEIENALLEMKVAPEKAAEVAEAVQILSAFPNGVLAEVPGRFPEEMLRLAYVGALVVKKRKDDAANPGP